MPLCACCARVFHLWRLQDQQFLLSRRFIPLVHLLNSTNWPKINSVYKQCHRSRKTKIRQIENKNPTTLNVFHVQLIPHPLFPRSIHPTAKTPLGNCLGSIHTGSTSLHHKPWMFCQRKQAMIAISHSPPPPAYCCLLPGFLPSRHCLTVWGTNPPDFPSVCLPPGGGTEGREDRRNSLIHLGAL